MLWGFNIGKVRASWISRYYYCGEQSRIRACLFQVRGGDETEHTRAGRLIHERLESRPQPLRVQRLWSFIRAEEPYRVLDGVEIYCHPDEFRVTRDNRVMVVEHKTSLKSKISVYEKGPASAQVRVYMWILRPYLERRGFRLLGKGRVIFWKRGGRRSGRRILWYEVEDDPVETEREIREIFAFWRGDRRLVLPSRWKCRQCTPAFKIRCRYYQRLAFDDEEWVSRFG